MRMYNFIAIKMQPTRDANRVLVPLALILLFLIVVILDIRS